MAYATAAGRDREIVEARQINNSVRARTHHLIAQSYEESRPVESDRISIHKHVLCIAARVS